MPEARTRASSVSLLRRALVAGALTLAVAACASAGPSPTPSASPTGSPSATPEPATPEPTPVASVEPPPNQPGSQEVTPSSPPKSVGEAEVITIFTHCGFEGRVDWAGSFWRETGRAPEGGPIGDPEDTGRMTLVSATEAAFESSTGTLVTLERVDGPVTLFPCD